MCAAHSMCCKEFERSAVASSPDVPRCAQAYRQVGHRQPSESASCASPSGTCSALDGGAGAAQAAEDGERVAGHGFPHEAPAGLDLAVDTFCERFGVFLRGGADDQVAPAALDRVALLLQAVSEIARLGM